MLLGSVIGISTAYSQAARAAAATTPPAVVQQVQAQPSQAQPAQAQPAQALEKKAAGAAQGQEVKAKEEANENLPGGGHSDPQGVNVDHQFNGVE